MAKLIRGVQSEKIFSPERAMQWFALMHAVADNMIDQQLAIDLMSKPHNIKIDFRAVRTWNHHIRMQQLN